MTFAKTKEVQGFFMQLRKVLQFNSILGLTLPKQFSQWLEIDKGDYLELSLGAGKIINIKKHEKFRPHKDPYGEHHQATI